MKLTYLKGKDNIIADALNVINPLEPESADKDDFDAIPVHHIASEIPATESWLERIRVATQADPILSQLKHQISQEWPYVRRGIPDSIHPFWNYRDELLVEEGLIFKTHKLVIPTSQKQEFLRDLHIGHSWEEKTLLQAQECVFWPGIMEDIKEYINKCDIC